MLDWKQLENSKVVRLNAVLNPNSFEAALFQHYHLNPVHVEAATPEEIIP